MNNFSHRFIKFLFLIFGLVALISNTTISQNSRTEINQPTLSELDLEFLGSVLPLGVIYTRTVSQNKLFDHKFFIGGSYLPEQLSLFGTKTITSALGYRANFKLRHNSVEIGVGITRNTMPDYFDVYHYLVFRFGYQANFKRSNWHWKITYTPVVFLSELDSYRSGDPFYYYFIPFAGTSIGYKF